MSDTGNDDMARFCVVMNDEEQYSLWPCERPLPPGWTAAGAEGTREECLKHIEEVWTDMRPLSLRRSMERKDSGEER
jgi:MbtH protein